MVGSGDFEENTRKALLDVCQGTVKYVQFPAALSFDERKHIHIKASHMGLQHRSFGEGDSRFVTVAKYGFDWNSYTQSFPKSKQSVDNTDNEQTNNIQNAEANKRNNDNVSTEPKKKKKDDE